jgi:hypothetical protein
LELVAARDCVVSTDDTALGELGAAGGPDRFIALGSDEGGVGESGAMAGVMAASSAGGAAVVGEAVMALLMGAGAGSSTEFVPGGVTKLLVDRPVEVAATVVVAD